MFSEATKTSVRRSAHFSCCLCHALGVEIHHIVPQAEGGGDEAENAAPLCPSCHETYGANPTKRRFVREARDLWYEICEHRYTADADRLEEIRRALDGVATKDDLEMVLNAITDATVRDGHLISLANEVVTELETARYQLDEAKSQSRGWTMLDMLPAAKFDIWQKDPDAVRHAPVMKALRGTYIWMHRRNMEMQRRELLQNVTPAQATDRRGLDLTADDIARLDEGISRIVDAQERLERFITDLGGEGESSAALVATVQGSFERTLVPPMHYETLRGLLESCQLMIGRQVRCEFGDPPNGRQLHRDAFFAHFPELAEPVSKWDTAVTRVEKARENFATALERTADAAGVNPTTYARPSILQCLQERTRPSLHLMLEEWPQGDVPIKGSIDGSIEVAGIRTNVRLADEELLGEEELRELVRPLIGLCDAARRLPEVTALAKAQDDLNQFMPAFSDEIKLHLVTEAIVVVEGCPICRRNLAR